MSKENIDITHAHRSHYCVPVGMWAKEGLPDQWRAGPARGCYFCAQPVQNRPSVFRKEST